MPGNYIYVSKTSSVRFVRVNPVVNSRYHTVHFDDDWFKNTIKKWQTQTDYYQKWQRNDTVFFQVLSNYGPIKIDLIDCHQRVIKTVNMGVVPTAIQGQPYSVYEASMGLADVPAGLYYFVLQGGFGDNIQKMVSEPQDIRLSQEDTILMEYRNSYNKGDIIWDTNIKMGVRFEGMIGGYQPGSEDTLFIDQPHNVVLLDSVPFRNFKLFVGLVPDWLVDRLNYAMGLDQTSFDGKRFVKSEGAKWERTEGAAEYPMAAWALDISEVENRDSVIFDDNFDDQVTVVNNIETDLFGSFPPGDGTIVIITNE